jgi:sugar-specific transcriptional regulator TrmB
MDDSLVKELIEIGLTEKEARVYLAALELGSATAQQIAAKATVERPSTYLAIEALKKKGLVSDTKSGKKIIFKAGDPKLLNYYIECEKRKVLNRGKKVSEIIKSLQTNKGSDEEVHVGMLKGYEGLSAHQDLVIYSDDIDQICEVVNLDRSSATIPPELVGESDIRREITARHKVFSIKQTETSKTTSNSLVNEKLISKKCGEIDASLHVHGDNSVFTVNNDKEPTVVVIESKAIASTLKALFFSAWNNH